MTARQTLWLVAATFVGLAATEGCAGRVRVPPASSATASRADFIRRGEYVFYSAELAPKGSSKTCASCHENHVPFEDYSLSRKFYDLPKLVDNCLKRPDRIAHKNGDYTELDARALREYLTYNYILKGVIADENPEGIRRLGEAMEAFLGGTYDRALGEVRSARELVKTKKNMVQSFALEGCIHLFRLNDREAREAFAAALKLDPEVRVDGYVFSPKVLKFIEETRQTLK